MKNCINFSFPGNAEKAKSLSKEFGGSLSPKQVGQLWNIWVEDPRNLSEEPTKEILAEIYGRLSSTSRQELLNAESFSSKEDILDALQSLFFKGLRAKTKSPIIIREDLLAHSVAILDKIPSILEKNQLNFIVDNYPVYREYLEKQRLSKFAIPVEDTDFEEKAVKDGVSNLSSVFFDNKGRASDEVVYLFASLTDPEDLIYGMERPLPFDKTWAIVQNTLGNSLDLDNQVEKLLAIQDRHPFVSTLLQRLGITKDGDFLPGYESVRTSFAETFAKQASDISNAKIGGKDSYSSLDHQTKMALITQAKTKFRNSKYAKKINGSLFLDKDAYEKLKLGNTDEDYKAFMSIFGIDLKAPLNPETRGHIKQIKKQLEMVDENIIWLDDRSLDVGGRLGNILDEEIPYEQEEKNLSTPNAEGKQQYSVHNHNYLSRTFSKFKQGVLKVTTPLTKLISEGKVKLEIISGLQSGDNSNSATFNDLYLTDIYTTMFNDMFSNNPIIHMPRTSDKSMERGEKFDVALNEDLAQTTITPALWKKLYSVYKQDASTNLNPKWKYGSDNTNTFWKEVADIEPTDEEAQVIAKLKQRIINDNHFALKSKLLELGVFYEANGTLQTAITNAILNKMGWDKASKKTREEILGKLVDHYNFNSFYFAVMNTMMTQGSMVGVTAENFYKRASGPVGEGRQVSTHKSFLDEITTDYKKYNLPYEAAKIKVMVHAETIEPSVKKLIKQSPAYEKNNVDDGGGVVTLPVYRTILKGANQWNPRQEEAYNTLMLGKKLPKHLKGVFQPIKPVGYSLVNVDGYDVPVYLKLAIYPISPSDIGTENQLKWDLSMQNGVSLFIPKSSIKMASPRELKSLLDSEGKIIDNPAATFDFPLEDFRIQLDINAKTSADQLQGTQQRKLLYTNLFEGGKPKDPKYKQWLDENIETLNKLSEIERKALYDRAGIETEDGSPVFKDYNKLRDVLREELISKDNPINVIESIDDIIKEGNLVGKIDSLPTRQKIMNLLNSIVNNSLIRLYTNGTSLVQISQQGWKINSPTDPTAIDFISKEAQETYFDKKGLQFFEIGETTGAAECILPAKYKKFVKKDAEGNTIIDDERVLINIGYRIPTQSHNSILHLRVVGFLPEHLDQMIILPKEITTQSGSDFDVDKINMFIPNTVTVGGKVQYISSEMDGEKIYNEREKEITEKGVDEATNKLMLAIFGDYDKYEETDPEQIANKEKWLERFEKQKLQNQLIEQTVRILEDVIVKDALLNPNGPGDLKESSEAVRKEQLAKDIQPRMLKVGYKNMFSGKTLLDITYQMFASKALVGVFASQATHHTLAQQVGLHIKTGRQFFFDHNKTEDGNADLSKEKGVTGYTISDRIGNNYLTAAVDAAKEDYLTDLGVNLQTGDVTGFFERIGGDPELLYRWINHPIIQEYLTAMAKNDSLTVKVTDQKKSKKLILTNILKARGISDIQYLSENYGSNPKEAVELYNKRKERGDLTIARLKKDDRDVYADILDDFLYLEDAAKILRRSISTSKFDTAGPGKDLIESYRLKLNFNKFVEDMNEGVGYTLTTAKGSYSDLITDTVLDVFYKNSFDFTLKLYEPLTVLMQGKVKELLRGMIFNGPFASKSANTLEADNIYGGIINYIIQNNVGFNKALFMGDNSIAKQILAIQKNDTHPLFYNNIVQEYFNIELGVDNNTPDLLVPVEKRLSSNQSDQTTASFQEIKDIDEDLYNDLLTVSLFQTGVLMSPSSFYSTLPHYDIIPTVNKLLLDTNIDNVKQSAIEITANIGRKLSTYPRVVLYDKFVNQGQVEIDSPSAKGKHIINLEVRFKSGKSINGLFYRVGESNLFKKINPKNLKSLFYNFVVEDDNTVQDMETNEEDFMEGEDRTEEIQTEETITFEEWYKTSEDVNPFETPEWNEEFFNKCIKGK